MLRFFDCDTWIGETEAYQTGGLNTAAALLAEMDRLGIDRALVYHVTGRTDQAAAGNTQLLTDLAGRPRLSPSWVASPRIVAEHGSAAQFTAAMKESGVRAVRMFPGEHGYRLIDAASVSLLEALNEAGAVLLLEAASALRDNGFTYDELVSICERHPKLNVILTQSGTMGEFSKLEPLVAVVQKVENLYVDTAKLQAHEGSRLFADRCGADRIVFASHLPISSAGAGVATVTMSGLTTAEQAQVAGANLSRLLGEGEDAWRSAGAARNRPAAITLPYPIIDVHGHVRPDGPPGEKRPDADGVVAQMDRTGIALAWVSETRGGVERNDVIARAVERYPDRLVPFACANPNDEDVRGELERCFDELHMKAIKVHPVGHDVEAEDARYSPVWEFANERGCLVVTHARCHEREEKAFTEIAESHPNLTLMLYHAGRSWDRADNFVAVARRCPNVLLEITYSRNVDGIIEYLIDQVGAERVFFGSDIGARSPECQVGWAACARIGERERRLLMHDNGLALMRRMGALPSAYAEHITAE